MEETDWVRCSCCGKDIPSSENVSADEEPYPHDSGYGMCRDCGGDDRAIPELKPDEERKPITDTQVRKRFGWAAMCFYDARIPIIRSGLNPKNQESFDKWSLLKKIELVQRAIQKGWLKW